MMGWSKNPGVVTPVIMVLGRHTVASRDLSDPADMYPTAFDQAGTTGSPSPKWRSAASTDGGTGCVTRLDRVEKRYRGSFRFLAMSLESRPTENYASRS
jgi:hypothetical protein